MKEVNSKILTGADIEAPEKKRLNPIAFSSWIRQLLQNWRQGTVKSKSRSEVNFTNKKPWKQKGTGRARAGSARSPLWKGGGVVFGPQPRTHKLKINKKMRKGILNNLLWQALDKKNIIAVDWQLSREKPKTSEAFALLKSINAHQEPITILLSIEDTLHYASFANIPNVNIVTFDEINSYDLALADKWIILKKDIDAFKQMVSSWT